MATDARIGYGSIFKIGDAGSPEVFTELAEVTSVTPPSISRDAVDVTHMASPDKYREFIAGLRDGGEVSLEMNFTAANAAAVIAQINSDLVGNKKIQFPDGSEWTFAALCTGFESDAPIDDKISASATFKISGKPSFVGI